MIPIAVSLFAFPTFSEEKSLAPSIYSPFINYVSHLHFTVKPIGFLIPELSVLVYAFKKWK